MNIRLSAISLILLFAVISGSPASSEITKIEKETQVAISNSKFTASAGWTFDDAQGKLIAPEGNLSVFLVMLPYDGNPAELVKKAWHSVGIDLNYKVLPISSPPPDEGWDEIHQVNYEVPVSESKSALAVIHVLKGVAYVMLLEGASATYEKRQSQIQIVADTWRPEGMKKEDLTNVVAKKFAAEDKLELDKFVAEANTALKIPGTAIAIIQDGQIVYKNQFGVKSLASMEKVTPETMFMIGSTTKPLTTLMLSKLVETGKLKWETPIYEALPQFQLADRDVSKKFLIKHTACACTGMPRRDMEGIFGSKIRTVEDTLNQLHTMKPTTGFGETFQYSNQLVAVGGLAGANVYGKGKDLFNKYENVMDDLVFGALKMSSTRVKPRDGDKGRLASPHAQGYDGEQHAMPFDTEDVIDPVAPSGNNWSTVDDMAKYVLMELRNGKDESGRQLFSEEQILLRRKPGIKVTDNCRYGLGLFIEKDKGVTVIHHGGNTLGFTSMGLFFPEKDIGMVLLSNASGVNALREAMRQKLMEIFLSARPTASEKIKYEVKSAKESQEKLLARCSDKSSDTAWIADYLGKYDNSILGPIEIVKNGDAYEIKTPRFTSKLGSAREQTGDKLIALLTPPWLGTELRVKETAGKTLILDDTQVKYEFTPTFSK